MIGLHKLDNTRILVSLETIKYIEETPDTLLRFLNGESLIVRESLSDIQELVHKSRVRIASSLTTSASGQPSVEPPTLTQ